MKAGEEAVLPANWIRICFDFWTWQKSKDMAN